MFLNGKIHSLISLLAGVYYTLSVLLPLVAADGDFILCQSESAPVIFMKRYEKTFNVVDGLFNNEEVQLSFEGKTITCIKVIDRWRDGTGGTASLIDGNVGTSSANILLQGQFFRGYAFDVIVHGEATPSHEATPTTTAPTTVAFEARISQSCFCGDTCERNIFDDRMFVPSFNLD